MVWKYAGSPTVLAYLIWKGKSPKHFQKNSQIQGGWSLRGLRLEGFEGFEGWWLRGLRGFSRLYGARYQQVIASGTAFLSFNFPLSGFHLMTIRTYSINCHVNQLITLSVIGPIHRCFTYITWMRSNNVWFEGFPKSMMSI